MSDPDLRGFALEMLDYFPDGAPDGFDLQRAAHRHGLLELEERTTPCGEHCGCVEFYGEGEVAQCYQRHPSLNPKETSDGD